MAITRRNLLKASAAGSVLGGMASMAGASPKLKYYFPDMSAEEVAKKAKPDEPIGDPVNVGFLGPLSGPDAGWGLPGLTGIQMFLDEVNANGGLLVGGTRYPLELKTFDDEAKGSKALQGAKKLVYQDKVQFINAVGGNPADAVHPFLTQNKVIYASLIATDIKPDRPYCIAGGDVTPRIDMLRPAYHKFEQSGLKRWAVTSQDDTIGKTTQAWEVGSAKAEGWDVVYDKHFTIDTTNFAPIVSSILSKKPDVVSLSLSYPTFVVQMIDQLYQQGFKGTISANYISTESALTRVPADFLHGATNSFPLFKDPWWGEESFQHRWYQQWQNRFGDGGPEDVDRAVTGIDWDHEIMLRIWAKGCEMAETFEPDEVLSALKAAPQTPTIIGPAQWGGEDMWGIDNMVSPPIPICEVDKEVKEKRIRGQWRFEEWFEARKDTIIKEVRDKGMMYDQR